VSGFLLLLFAATAAAAPLPIAELSRTEPVDFAREIHPVLKRNCLACHNTTKAKSDLNLESPDLIRKGGESGPAVVPGKSAESLLLKTAAHLDEDLVMPPPGNKVKAVNLTSEELALFRLWIDQGAKGESIESAKGPLPWRAAAVGAPLNAVAISPDGRLAAAARGNRLELYETATGKTLAELSDPELAKKPGGKAVADLDAVMSAAFASDDLLATGGFRTVRLWRRMPRVVKRDFGALPEAATVLAVSPDGQWAASGDAKGGILLWNLAAEKFEPTPLKEHASPITALAFSPDNGALVSTAEDKSVRHWDVASRAVKTKGEATAPIRALAFLEGGAELVAACGDGTARVWTWTKELPPALPAPVREMKLQEQAVLALAPVKGGVFAWGAADGTIRIATAADGKEQRKITPEHPAARRVALLERELQIAQGLVNTRKAALAPLAAATKKEAEDAVKATQALEKARPESQTKRDEASGAADALRLSLEDKALQEAAKRAGDAANKAEAAFRAAKVNAELGARRAADAAGAQAAAEAGAAGAEARLAEAQSLVEAGKKALGEQPPGATAIVFSPDGAQALLTAANGEMRRIAAESGALLEPPDRAGVTALLPNGELLAAGADKRVRLTSARRVWALERTIGSADDPAPLADRVLAVAFSPDGKLLASGGGTPSRDGELKLWRVADGTLVRQIAKAHGDTVNGLAFSPDGDFLASAGSDRFARVWQISDGTRLANLEGHTGHVLSVSWRADGLVIATGGADRSVRLWDVTTRKQTKVTNNFGGEIAAVTFVGGSDLLLAASSDKAVRLGEQALPESGGIPFCATSDAAGKTVAAGSHDGVLRLWNVSDRKLVRTFPTPATP